MNRPPRRRERQEQAVAPASDTLAQVGPTLWWQSGPQPEIGQTFCRFGQTHRIETVTPSDGGWLFTTNEGTPQ